MASPRLDERPARLEVDGGRPRRRTVAPDQGHHVARRPGERQPELGLTGKVRGVGDEVLLHDQRVARIAVGEVLVDAAQAGRETRYDERPDAEPTGDPREL